MNQVTLEAEHTLGLIGLGENSGEIARRMRHLGMRVVYHKRHRLSEWEEEALGGAKYLPLGQLLAECDFVSLHVPYGPETDRMVSEAFLARMRPTAFLINTSRGGIVDERALFEALKTGRIAGAALDVHRYEPIPPNYPLLTLDNIIWTPHMAGGEPEFLLREVDDTLSNLSRVWRGVSPTGLVTAK